MWLLTPQGFFSAVVSADSEADLLIRTRHRDDVDNLNASLRALGFAAKPLIAYAGSDYAWRIVVPKNEWVAFLAQQVDDLQYDNFKSEVTKTQGIKRHDIYMRVWTALLAIEQLPGAARGKAKAIRQTPDRPSRWTRGGHAVIPSISDGKFDGKFIDSWSEDWGRIYFDEPCIDWSKHADCSRHVCTVNDENCPV